MLWIVKWEIDDFESLECICVLEDFFKVFLFVDSESYRAKTFCEFDKVRIPKSETPLLHPATFLFPLNHPIRTIIQNDEGDIEAETDCGFDVSEVHHESTITGYTDDISIWIFHLCCHSG